MNVLTWSSCDKYICAVSFTATCGLTIPKTIIWVRTPWCDEFWGHLSVVFLQEFCRIILDRIGLMVVAEKTLNVQKRQTKPNQQQNQPTKNKNREEKSGNKGINDKNNSLYYSVIPNLLLIRSSGATEKEENCSNSLYHHHLDHENESMLCCFHLFFFLFGMRLRCQPLNKSCIQAVVLKHSFTLTFRSILWLRVFGPCILFLFTGCLGNRA